MENRRGACYLNERLDGVARAVRSSAYFRRDTPMLKFRENNGGEADGY